MTAFRNWFWGRGVAASLDVRLLLWLAIAAYFVLAGVSYWNSFVGVASIVAFIAVLTIVRPIVGWALTIFVIPFQRLFGIGDSEYFRILGPLLLIVAAQAIPVATKYRAYRSPMVIVLLCFATLVCLHELTDDTDLREMATGAFVLSLVGLYIMSRRFCAQPDGLRAIQTVIIVGPLLAALLSALFLYVPLPSLIPFHAEITNLRLSGAVHNPNALGKLLMFSIIFLVCSAAIQQKNNWRALLLTFVLAVLVAATLAKSVLLACVLVLVILLPLSNSSGLPEKKLHFWRFPIVVAVGWAAWMIVSALWVERHAALRWVEQAQLTDLCHYIPTPRPKACAGDTEESRGLATLILKDFRLDGSREMTEKDGKIEYKRRDFRISQIGQRDRTWSAGLVIVKENYLWGIGDSNQWKKHMQQLLGFPFDSPHNVLLEVGGGYGLLGLGLYFTAIAVFLKNYLRLRKINLEPYQRAANESIFMCGVAILVVEMVDVATIFGATMHAIWFWTLAGMQAGLQDASATTKTSDASPEPARSALS